MSTVVGDIMTKDVMVARDHWSAKELAVYFSDNRITGTPVVDINGELLGAVSVTDLVKVTGYGDLKSAQVDSVQDYFSSFLGQSFSEGDAQGLMDMAAGSFNVRDIMTSTIQKISPELAVKEAAKLLVDKNIHRVFVIDNNDQLVGICSSTDLLRYFSQT